MLAQQAGVNGEEVDALCRLLFEGLEDQFVVEVLDAPVEDHRVNGHRADGDGAVFEHSLAAAVRIAAGGQVHDGIGAKALGPLQLFEFLVRAAGKRRRAHVGVDLGQRGPADADRLEPVAQMHLVGGYDHAPGGDFVAHLLGRQVRLTVGCAAHFRGDHAQARVFELGYGGEGFGRRPLACALPVRRHEVPGRLAAGRGHAGAVRGSEGDRAGHEASLSTAAGSLTWHQTGVVCRFACARFPTPVSTGSGSKGGFSVPAAARPRHP